MAELDPFGAPAGAPGGPALGNGVAGAGEEDPAAAFLAQQESEIAGIENDEAFAILDGGAPGPQPHGEPPGGPDANSRKQEAEWKEKAIKELEEWYARQDEQLQKTKANNRVADEAFYKQPFADVIGYVTNINHPCYSLEQAAEEAFVNDIDESSPGTEWERVARLCDFNPKSSKQAKDVSRMRSVLISLKQAPLVH
ncbi:clathrin light chain A isoform X5 [Leopardus geoffroyi]|uniref:Clathrin light chain n=11 Tax=Boreoeutheria TaxID=1437010 RepID=C9J8P9_HUMAN|nr:clathrin light chain A isoform h [Homo sapiens]XP_019671751.1 clathrin light chain A isoform X5 [Felis catus]XP_025214757.1 clathrin light chain A isoform X6 [Theropithecus gelada]XP_025770811.1 clathrin light chain A isoform X6 [Puma concolor]XP_042127000.1 clathrin light chain A isoform X5 [Peromyscus maniculatus bairdii]XP_043422133.1 clathrin light chain A isoform X5 [Prionailurus bengalensis]XP_045325463.1 clathrin light chain A isoform X5 [Leopardus geoffroyi]XP_055149725.1 clathrin|eukprot:NP_001298133.1 clathrin light chain A isoform h [Homo sapiens]